MAETTEPDGVPFIETSRWRGAAAYAVLGLRTLCFVVAVALVLAAVTSPNQKAIG